MPYQIYDQSNVYDICVTMALFFCISLLAGIETKGKSLDDIGAACGVFQRPCLIIYCVKDWYVKRDMERSGKA
jgi:hypothetical protein